MYKTYNIATFLILCSFNFFGQNLKTTNNSVKFEKEIITHFQNKEIEEEGITRDLLYKSNMTGNNYDVCISNKPILFDISNIVIKNPYFSKNTKKLKEDNIYVKNFPKSYSVIYEHSLISLFENGSFTCFELENFKRDISFEEKLNKRKFKYHWIVDEKLNALSGNNIYVWNGKDWEKSSKDFPLKNKPKLFEDKKFIVYVDCHGKWGGTIYFYEKKTGETFFTDSTCANSVLKKEEGYQVLAHLEYEAGITEIKIIKDPRKLTKAYLNEINKTVDGEALGYIDESEEAKHIADFHGIQTFSSFLYKNRELYLVNLKDLTFIAEINENNIEIVHPLFSNDLYTHDSNTTKYGDYTLINLDNHGIGLDREISVIVIDENRIQKLDWNKVHID